MKAKQFKALIFMCWGVGSVGLATMNLSRTLILRFMTDNLEIAASFAGLIFAFSKIYDAITDPLMGQIADRRVNNKQDITLYILLGAILCPIAYILTFNIPTFCNK